MPEGYFGLPRLTNIGPLVENKKLYHVTSEELVPEIRQNGLQTGISAQQISSLTDIGEQKAEQKIKKTHGVEHLMDMYRPDFIDSRMPRRKGSIYTWTTFDSARRSVIENVRDMVIELDQSKIQQYGGVALNRRLGDIERALFSNILHDAIYEDVAEVRSDGRVIFDTDTIPAPLYEKIYSIWSESALYDAQSGPSLEVWFDKNISSDAITNISKETQDRSAIKTSGNISIDDFGELETLKQNIREAYRLCSEEVGLGEDMKEIFITGKYATGDASANFDPLIIQIVPDNISVTDSEKSQKLSNVIQCMNLRESRISDNYTEFVRQVQVNNGYSTAAVLGRIIEDTLGRNTFPRQGINLTTRKTISAQEAAERLNEEALTRAVSDTFPELQGLHPNEQARRVDRIIFEEFGIEI